MHNAVQKYPVLYGIYGVIIWPRWGNCNFVGKVVRGPMCLMGHGEHRAYFEDVPLWFIIGI